MAQRIFNFSAGPAVLPVPVLEEARDNLLSLGNTGIGILEHSHRGKAFIKVLEETEARFRELASIPANSRGDGRRGWRNDGQAKRKDTAPTGSGTDQDLPAVLLDDGLRQTQTEARPVCLCREERQEDFVNHVGCDAASVVSDLDFPAACRLVA